LDRDKAASISLNERLQSAGFVTTGHRRVERQTSRGGHVLGGDRESTQSGGDTEGDEPTDHGGHHRHQGRQQHRSGAQVVQHVLGFGQITTHAHDTDGCGERTKTVLRAVVRSFGRQPRLPVSTDECDHVLGHRKVDSLGGGHDIPRRFHQLHDELLDPERPLGDGEAQIVERTGSITTTTTTSIEKAVGRVHQRSIDLGHQSRLRRLVRQQADHAGTESGDHRQGEREFPTQTHEDTTRAV